VAREELRALTLTFLLTILGVAFQSDQQSGVLKKASAPQPEVLNGYNRGHCVSVTRQLRVCKQLSDERDVFVVEKDGAQVGVWPARAAMGETSDFEVLRSDFNYDGRSELILANHDGTSNGLGVDYWTITIFPDTNFNTVVEPLTFSVEEYGTFGTFVADSHARLSILATRWVWTNDPKGKRDEGLYLVGHWWRYESGELVPQLNRATLARRYLFSFANERGETSGTDHIPYRWLKNARTERLKAEQITGPSWRSETGVIADVSTVTKPDSERSVKISLRAVDGSTVVYRYPKPEREGLADPGLDFLGDAASGSIYPISYFPSRIEAWLEGKRATVRTYGNEQQAEKILWLSSNR
jgi:hypothetical protein